MGQGGTKAVPTKVYEFLRSVPVLSHLSKSEIDELASKGSVQNYKVGATVISEGGLGDAFYIINSGDADVIVHNTKVGKLAAGDYFGETALLNPGSKRVATIKATTAMQCFKLTEPVFRSFFTHHQSSDQVKFAKRKAVSAENAGSSAIGAPSGSVKEKDEKTFEFISKAVKGNLLFDPLPAATQKGIIEEMYRMDVRASISPIKQGDKGDNFYVVESGSFDIFVDGKKVATRADGTCFGELALLYNAPRAATVTATTNSVVWVVDRFTFRRLREELTNAKMQEYQDILASVPLLKPLSNYEREKISEAIEEISLKPGEYLFKQGDVGDAVYFVSEGELIIDIDGNEVARTTKGGYTGERSLLKSEPRAGSAKAASVCSLLRLDANSFTQLLGPLEDIMTSNVEKYNEKKSLPAPKAKKAKIKFNDLRVVGVLGKGSFGRVILVSHAVDGTTYALKAVSKYEIVQTGQEQHIMSEKTCMELFDHPFLVKLYATYKDHDRLYFLLEPCLGGDLFNVLRNKGTVGEPDARFYAASVVLAFEYMHGFNIIYRDLKPENLLLNNEGFLKVTDFGFARHIVKRTFTLCGTPDYLAPEIVGGKGHGKGVDWWTLGVFIFEMLASYPPFYDDDPMMTYEKILHKDFSFPMHFSKDAVALISRLLQRKPTKRLGVLKGGAKLIKKHPWFSGFDFDALVNLKMKTPFIPKVKNNYDISNFPEYPDMKDDTVQVYVDNGTNWDADF